MEPVLEALPGLGLQAAAVDMLSMLARNCACMPTLEALRC